MGLGSDNGDGFTTRPLRIFMWGFGFGLLTMALGVGINWGDMGGLFDRVRNGVEAVQEEPVPTTAPVAVTP